MQDSGLVNTGNIANGEFTPKDRSLSRMEKAPLTSYYMKCLFSLKTIITHPNNMVEAEIYYVLIIAGIEYAICISDPDISEYTT